MCSPVSENAVSFPPIAALMLALPRVRHPVFCRDPQVAIENAQVDAVAFDHDGLMFNTEELYEECGSEILRRRGKQFTSGLLSAMMGRQSHVALQIMIDWHQLDATVAELEAETDAIFDGMLSDRLEPMEGLLDLLGALEAQGIPKAITTSSRRRFVDDCLRISGLTGRFEFILSAEDVVHGKPAPEIYETAAARFQVPPGRLLVLEDSPNGCRAAVLAGTFAVAIPERSSKLLAMTATTDDASTFEGVRFVASSLADRQIYNCLGIATTE